MGPALLEGPPAVLQQSGGPCSVATGQQQRRGRQRDLGGRFGTAAGRVQQLFGFLQASLADPEAGQSGQRFAMQARAAVGGDSLADTELALGVVPPAGGGEHAAVVDAALGIEEWTAVRLDEPVGDPAPLRRPVRVARQLAGIEHVATRVDDGLQVGRLAAQRRGHRLVDQREPTCRVALADTDQPEL